MAALRYFIGTLCVVWSTSFTPPPQTCTGCAGNSVNSPGQGGSQCSALVSISSVASNGMCELEEEDCVEAIGCVIAFAYSWSFDSSCDMGLCFQISGGGAVCVAPAPSSGSGTDDFVKTCGGEASSATLALATLTPPVVIVADSTTEATCNACVLGS